MPTRRLGIVMHGVTGRMGTNQHLVRSIRAIMDDGGVVCGDTILMPDPVLAGRNAEKVAALAAEHGGLAWTTDVESAVADDACDILFDAAATSIRPRMADIAARHGKAFYCEKPTATNLADALAIWRSCEDAGIKHGVVQDKLFLPGLMTLARLRDDGFFSRILSVRGEFGYWVFTGHDSSRPAQRPSWNYRLADGGGIAIDMFAHWRYVIDHLFGNVTDVCAHVATEIPERLDESGTPYACTADDAAYAIMRTAAGITCQFNSSWTTRVRRDDLLTIQVDGTNGSAVAGLRDCWVQSDADTPRPVWNPDIPQPVRFADGWTPVPPAVDQNAFRTQWEMFLRHVALDEPWSFDLLAGARGVQLAELALQSSRDRTWVAIPDLS